MSKPTHFDVLVVYSESAAVSAAFSESWVPAPFPPGSSNESYNVVYAYFLQTCKKKGLKAAFTTSADIIAPGTCRSYWVFEQGSWQKVVRPAYAERIFTKVTPTNEEIARRRNLLFSSERVRPFNAQHIFTLFSDKQRTYEALREFSIPTAPIRAKTTAGVTEALRELTALIKQHPHSNDFAPGIIMKDRFGAGGENIFKFVPGEESEMVAAMRESEADAYILQPFLKFDRGYTYRGEQVPADIRLVYLGGTIVQTYVRIAKRGDFRCNEHQGAALHYIRTDQVPESVLKIAGAIAPQLSARGSLFALDFVVSNAGNPYLLEGNPAPGLDWNLELKRNERESHKLIEGVVDRLKQLVQTPIAAA